MGTVLDLLLALSVVVLALVLQVQLGKSSACNWVFLHDTITIPESDKDPPIMEVHPETGVRDPTTPDFSPTNGTTRSKEPRAMSKYNITVVRITKTSTGYEGEFTLSDQNLLLMVGGSIRQCQATLKSEVVSVPWEGNQIAKIKGTIGQRKGTFVPATIADTGEEVAVDWQAGHRSAVAAAFASAWGQLAASGADHIDRPTITSRTKTPAVAAPVVNNAEMEELKALVKQQAEMLALLMAQNEAAKKGK